MLFCRYSTKFTNNADRECGFTTLTGWFDVPFIADDFFAARHFLREYIEMSVYTSVTLSLIVSDI